MLARPNALLGTRRIGGALLSSLLGTSTIWVESAEGDYWSSGDYSITTNADPTPDVFDSVVNRGTLGGTFAASSTARPSVAHIPVGEAARRVWLFDGVDDVLESSIAAASHKQLHYAATVAWVLRAKDAGPLFYTCAKDPSATGIHCEYDATNQRVSVYVCNGSGTYLIQAHTANGSVLPGDVAQLMFTFGASIWSLKLNGAAASSGTKTGTRSTSDPTHTLRIGGANGNIGAFCAWPQAQKDVTTVGAYLRTRYRDTAYRATMRASAHRFFHSIRYPDFYTVVGGKIAEKKDLSGNARYAYQGTDSLRPTLDLTGFFGLPCAIYDGTKEMNIGSGVGWGSSTSHHLLVAFDPDNATGTGENIFVSASGVQFAHLGASSGDVEVYDGVTWRDIGNAAVGPQILEWSCPAGGTATGRRDTVALDVDPFAAVTISGAVTFGTGFHGCIAEVSMANAALTGTTLSAWQTEVYARSFGARTIEMVTTASSVTFGPCTVYGDWSIEWGDGKTTAYASGAATPTHTYSGAGPWTITVHVAAPTSARVLRVNSMSLTALDVSQVAGLETFTAQTNQLTSIDVSKNTGLASLNLISNKLTALDVSALTALTSLELTANSIKTLDASSCTKLVTLKIENNGCTSLTLPATATLTTVRCFGNALTSLDVSSCTGITSLLCQTNQLTSLDTSACSGLVELNCSVNSLTTLTQGNSTALRTLYAQNNSLTAANVSANTGLKFMRYDSNSMAQAAVDAVLTGLAGNVGSGLPSGGNLNISSNAVPSSSGLTAKSTLEGHGWTVTVDT